MLYMHTCTRTYVEVRIHMLYMHAVYMQHWYYFAPVCSTSPRV